MSTGMGSGDQDSWELVRAAQRGDREAFGQLYTRYQLRVARFVGSRVRDAVVAEDLTSETFLHALRGIDTLTQQRRDPGAWLSTIARNVVFDHMKSSGSRLTRPVDEIPEPRAAGTDDGSAETQALNRMDRARAVQAVRRGMAGLCPAHQDALHAYMQGRSNAQEAARTQVSVAAAKASRHRAVTALRRRLAEQGITSAQEHVEDPPPARAGHEPRRGTDPSVHTNPARAAVDHTAVDQTAVDQTAVAVRRACAQLAQARQDLTGRPRVVEPGRSPAHRRLDHELPGPGRSDLAWGDTHGTGAAPDRPVPDETTAAVAEAHQAVAQVQASTQPAVGDGGRVEQLARWYADDEQACEEAAGRDQVGGRGEGWAASRGEALVGSSR